MVIMLLKISIRYLEEYHILNNIPIILFKRVFPVSLSSREQTRFAAALFFVFLFKPAHPVSQGRSGRKENQATYNSDA